MNISPHCNELLNKSLIYHPLYGNRLANHLPMALVALDQLGSTSDELSRFYTGYRVKLKPRQPHTTSCLHAPIHKYLGRSEYFECYYCYFQDALETQHFDYVLSHAIAFLMPGIAASAFHAIIRLAYAIQSANKTDIALSLAYWAAEFQPFHSQTKTTNQSLPTILQQLSPLCTDHPFTPGTITDNMNEVAHLLNQQSLLQPQTISLVDIAELCISTYTNHPNFTVLHTVTACHAFRIIAPYVEDSPSALRYLWEAIIIALLSTGLCFETAKPISAALDIDWQRIKQHACHSNDAHVIKLIYTCWHEYIEYGNPAYYFVADQVRRNHK